MRLEQRQLAEALQAQGLDRRAAARMAEEWFAHCDDLAADSPAPGVSLRRQEAMLRMGDPQSLVLVASQLPGCARSREVRAGAAVAVTWGGAFAAGLLATVSRFGAMTAAIGL